MKDLRAEVMGGADKWPADAQALTRLLVGRYSCRAYKPEPVPDEVIQRMLEMAQLAASWCNSQPWQVIVTSGEGTERFRTVLHEHATRDQRTGGAEKHGGTAPRSEPDFPFPAAYTGIYKARQRDVGWQLYESVGIAYGDRVGSAAQVLKNFELFGAPHALVVTSERDLGVYGAIDCGLYVQALLLAAQSLGLGMIPQAALATYAPVVREHFGLPENRMIVLGCSFGYPDPDHPANGFRSRRADLDEVVTWVRS